MYFTPECGEGNGCKETFPEDSTSTWSNQDSSHEPSDLKAECLPLVHVKLTHEWNAFVKIEFVASFRIMSTKHRQKGGRPSGCTCSLLGDRGRTLWPPWDHWWKSWDTGSLSDWSPWMLGRSRWRRWWTWMERKYKHITRGHNSQMATSTA